ncbi:MAG: hypothetical protein ACRD3Q_07895 [Terriglobales bacterium]
MSAHFFVSIHGVRVDILGLGAFAIAGAQSAWHAFRRWESEDWTTVDGQVTLTEVTKKHDQFRLRLLYWYKVPGQKEASNGEYTKDFDDDDETTATQWTTQLRDSTIRVHCNPSKPDDSLLWDSDLQAVVDGRSPSPEDTDALALGELLGWEKAFLPATLLLAGVGLLFSVVIHVAAFAGVSHLKAIGLFGMQGLAIVLVFPVAQTMKANKRTSSGLMSNWPEWLKILGHLFFYYAILSVLLFFFIQSSGQESFSFHFGDEVPPDVIRFFSTVWMFMFVGEFAVVFTRLFCRNQPPDAKKGTAAKTA